MFFPGFHLFQIVIFLGRRVVESNNALLEIMLTVFKKCNDICLCLKQLQLHLKLQFLCNFITEFYSLGGILNMDYSFTSNILLIPSEVPWVLWGEENSTFIKHLLRARHNARHITCEIILFS